ncbi:MAG: hypothetical protein J6S73_02080 [Lentisphaeria bacterium]|nr:hypothetical protein [Lentisphaeria bacterium]
MKKQDCSIFMEEVLTVETPLTGPAALHVQSCPECAALREMAEKCAVKTAVPEIPAALDRAVLAYAGESRRRQRIRQLFFRRIMPAVTAAAAAVVCVVALLPEEKTPPERNITLAAADAANEWNMLESEAFKLNHELTSCQNDVADWQVLM